MSSKSQVFLAKLLIVFSVILILWGAFLDISSNKILHPIDDVTVLAGLEEDIISITTVDNDEKVESVDTTKNTVITNPIVILPIDGGNNSSGGSSNNSNTNSNENSSGDVNTNNSSGSTNNNTGTGNTNNNSVSDNKPVVPTIEEANLKLRAQIEEMYGVKVKYGNETLGYSVGGMTTVALPDAATMQAALVNLNVALSLYPTGFFSEIKSKGYSLNFYLIKRYSIANVTGVTDSSNKNVIISIATDYDFVDTVHHEVYHYIERYILSTGFRFTSWNTLNPLGFNYGTVVSDYSYSKTFASDAAFVNSYAQTDEYEDRASTFEYMMKSSKASCLNKGNTVWLKAKTMSEQIDYFLTTVTPDVTEYWERHIY